MGRARIRCPRGGVEPEAGDSKCFFRAHPGFSLYGTRFLMRQNSPIDRQRPPVIAVANAGLLLAVISKLRISGSICAA